MPKGQTSVLATVLTAPGRTKKTQPNISLSDPAESAALSPMSPEAKTLRHTLKGLRQCLPELLHEELNPKFIGQNQKLRYRLRRILEIVALGIICITSPTPGHVVTPSHIAGGSLEIRCSAAPDFSGRSRLDFQKGANTNRRHPTTAPLSPKESSKDSQSSRSWALPGRGGVGIGVVVGSRGTVIYSTGNQHTRSYLYIYIYIRIYIFTNMFTYIYIQVCTHVSMHSCQFLKRT